MQIFSSSLDLAKENGKKNLDSGTVSQHCNKLRVLAAFYNITYDKKTNKASGKISKKCYDTSAMVHGVTFLKHFAYFGWK